MAQHDDEKKHLFDDPKNVNRVIYGLYIVSGLSLVLDFFTKRPVDHPWESMWIFYCVYGFASCVVLVLIASEMRKFIMRDEDYYDD